jgi:hypothetical protein
MIVTRNSKGAPLTHNELDNNFTELETGLNSKANASEVFTKSESNTNFAQKGGSETTQFLAQDGTLPQHVATMAQFNAKEKVFRYNLFNVSGTANDIALTLQGDRVGTTAIEAGVEVNFVAAFDNTGPVIVTVDFVTESFNDIPITKTGAVPLVAGDIIEGAAYKLIYDGTGFQLFGGVGGASTPVDLSNYYTKSEVDDEVAKSRIPPGFIFAFPTNNIPVGYIKCEHQYLLIADFPDLFAAIGHTFDGDDNPDPLLYFRVPEMRGEFLRGLDNGRFVDNSRVNGKLTNGSAIITLFDDLGNGIGIGMRISGTGIPAGTTITGFNLTAGTVNISAAATTTTSSAITLTVTGRTVGTYQAGDIQSHEHSLQIVSTTSGGVGTVAIDRRDTGSGAATMQSQNKALASGGPESRPRNLAVCYCIKAFDTINLPAEVEWDAFVTMKVEEILFAFIDDQTADLIKIGDKVLLTGTYTGLSSGATTSAVINFGLLATMNAGYKVLLQRQTRPSATFSISDVPTISAKTGTSFTITSSVAINSSWSYDWMVIGSGTPT